MSRNKISGFTLVELIVVIVIIGTLSVITLPLLHSGFNAYLTQRNLSDANWQGRLALDRFSRDIRDLPSAANITTATATQLVFTDSSNTSVTYALSGTLLQRNAITLANGINTLTFGYYNSSGAVTATIANMRYVSILLNVTKNGVNTNLQTVINFRNVVP